MTEANAAEEQTIGTERDEVFARPYPAVKLGSVVPNARVKTWKRSATGALHAQVGWFEIWVRPHITVSGTSYRWRLEPLSEIPCREGEVIAFGIKDTEDAAVRDAEDTCYGIFSDALGEFAPVMKPAPEWATARIGGLAVVHFDNAIQITSRADGIFMSVGTAAPFVWMVSFDTRPELPESAFTEYDGQGRGVSGTMIEGFQAAVTFAQAARKEAAK